MFAGLAGEVWNYMGSKRLVWDLNGTATGGNTFTQGLNLSSIDQVRRNWPSGHQQDLHEMRSRPALAALRRA